VLPVLWKKPVWAKVNIVGNKSFWQKKNWHSLKSFTMKT
jgi:hypothetical protein